jgi:C-terminal processing protease CtpA/Prc
VPAGRRLRGGQIELSGEVTATDAPSSGEVAVTLAESTENGQKRITLKSVMPGSEAERAGLAENDIIARIDERAPTSLEDARHLSGPLGDDVLVEVLREGEIHKLRVARKRVRRLASDRSLVLSLPESTGGLCGPEETTPQTPSRTCSLTQKKK